MKTSYEKPIELRFGVMWMMCEVTLATDSMLEWEGGETAACL